MKTLANAIDTDESLKTIAEADKNLVVLRAYCSPYFWHNTFLLLSTLNS